jgi:RHS repeat-associated protein
MPPIERSQFPYTFQTNNRTDFPQGGQVRATQVFDASGQLTGIASTTALGVLVRRLTYSYDQAVRRLTQQTADGTRTTWSYDQGGQLTREQRNGSLPLALTHVYDPAGNRRVQINAGIRTSYTFDAANELTLELTGTARTTYQFDMTGNRIVKNAPAATTFYNWDAKNRMSVAEPVSGRVSYSYDGSGRRVTKQVGATSTRYVWDFEKLLQEADGNSGMTEHQFLNTDQQYGNLVSGYDGTQTKYYELDVLGSVDELLDNNGSVTDAYKYSAFALTTQTQGSDPQPFAFVGQFGYQYDSETSLYYLGAGSDGGPYDPNTIQFLRKDPIEFGSGTANAYLYCKNDPVNCTDPSGNWIVTRTENDALAIKGLIESWTDSLKLSAPRPLQNKLVPVSDQSITIDIVDDKQNVIVKNITQWPCSYFDHDGFYYIIDEISSTDGIKKIMNAVQLNQQQPDGEQKATRHYLLAAVQHNAMPHVNVAVLNAWILSQSDFSVKYTIGVGQKDPIPAAMDILEQRCQRIQQQTLLLMQGKIPNPYTTATTPSSGRLCVVTGTGQRIPVADEVEASTVRYMTQYAGKTPAGEFSNRLNQIIGSPLPQPQLGTADCTLPKPIEWPADLRNLDWANRDLADKLRDAARLALPLIDKEIYDDVKKAIEDPTTWALVVGFFFAGLVASAFGVGEVVAGLAALLLWLVAGVKALDATADMVQFLLIASSAKTEKHIEKAACYFVKAIASVTGAVVAAKLAKRPAETSPTTETTPTTQAPPTRIGGSNLAPCPKPEIPLPNPSPKPTVEIPGKTPSPVPPRPPVPTPLPIPMPPPGPMIPRPPVRPPRQPVDIPLGIPLSFCQLYPLVVGPLVASLIEPGEGCKQDEDCCEKQWDIKAKDGPKPVTTPVTVTVDRGKVPSMVARAYEKAASDGSAVKLPTNVVDRDVFKPDLLTWRPSKDDPKKGQFEMWDATYNVVVSMVFRGDGQKNTKKDIHLPPYVADLKKKPDPAARRFALEIAGGKDSGHVINDEFFMGPGTIIQFPNIVPLIFGGNSKQRVYDKKVNDLFYDSETACVKYVYRYPFPVLTPFRTRSKQANLVPASFSVKVIYKDKDGWHGPVFVGSLLGTQPRTGGQPYPNEVPNE